MPQPAGAYILFNSNVYETGFVSLLSFANGVADIVATWPNKSAKTPTWVLGATVK